LVVDDRDWRNACCFGGVSNRKKVSPTIFKFKPRTSETKRNYIISILPKNKKIFALCFVWFSHTLFVVFKRKYVIVDFKDYKSPALFEELPTCTYVPIVPFQANWIDFKQRYRNQIPLDLAFVITIHKSQGLTLERAVIDLGKSENQNEGISLLSRLRTFEGPW
jgi:hypothetical protein